MSPQCEATESGGFLCERPAGHEGDHWISRETIDRRYPSEHPRADCEGCKRHDCPCNWALGLA